MIKTLNVLFSIFKCIKIVNTRYVLIDAIIKAITIVALPKFIPATATVIAVKVNKASQTII